MEPGPLPGAQAGSQLRLLRALGQGGMGSVWLAEHVALRTQVAVKFLRDTYADHPLAVERLRREAEAAARIQSPHVVRVFDLGCTDQGTPYIVMEHLEGETLHDLLARRGRLSLDETACIVRQLGAALARAHEAGVVHRDIKPENVFLVAGERDPFVKVLDFGIAKDTAGDAERLTMTGAILGTPHFMSPEQMAGGTRVGPASDLWSLGVVSYLCLTGRTPFGGATIAAVAVAIDRGPPPLPSRLVPGLPPAIDAWLLSLLQPDPARRAQSARDVLDALDAALAAPRDARPAAARTEPTPARDALASGEGFPSLVTTLLPFVPLGPGSPGLPARKRAWAVAAAAILGAGTLAWAGASGVTRAAPAVQPAQIASLGLGGDGPAERPASPAAGLAAHCAPGASQPGGPGAERTGAPDAPPSGAPGALPSGAQGAPSPGAPDVPQAAPQAALGAPGDSLAPDGVQAARSAARSAPAALPAGKKVTHRARARRDLGF
ncbi:protein kinase [Sorangium sp. So ce1036]|uniref:serine/threonine-protein kinase n=1 Tax=Sorangium sp. So ce1036 TaxID=3133328 RepID=UPI003F07AD42